jgi:hypothetical protein
VNVNVVSIHDQFSIDRPDFADTPIYKRLHNGKDIVVSVEFAALRQDIYNVKINMIPNNDNYHFR